jgi:hypothetical protein
VGDQHYDLDCVIFASGFEVGTTWTRRNGFDIHGLQGKALSEAWADGMESLHGIHAKGFPNLFVMGPTQGANLWSNITFNLTEAAKTIAQIIAHAQQLGSPVVTATDEAVDNWVGAIEAAGRRGLLGGAECTPGYYNNEGQEMGRREMLNFSGYPAGSLAYFEYIDGWRQAETYEGLVFSTSSSGR